MRCLSFILLTLFSFTYHSTAQPGIAIKLQFQHTDVGFAKKLRVAVNNELYITNDSGLLRLVLPKSTNSIKIALPLSTDLLLYPPDGHLPIPKNLKEVSVVIIGSTAAHYQLKKYLDLYRLKNRSSGDELSILGDKVDSLRRQLLKSNVTETIIRSAEKVSEEKQSYMLQVIADITAFRNSIGEFKNSYKYLATQAFEKVEALDALIQSANHYDSCYKKFEKQHASYEMVTTQYWSNSDVIADLRSYSDFVINKVHAPCIYPMQEAILQIRQYFSGKKKNKNLRKSIEMDTGRYITAIENMLPELDRETTRLLLQLSQY